MESTDSSTGSQQPQLPPGFRFHPTDEELVVHYLKKKAAAAPLPVSIIAEVDLYKFDPWELPAKAIFGEQEWYFFSPRDRKYPNGARPNRAATSGYWKATGTDKPVLTAGGTHKVGVKKALVFYGGKPPKGIKTNWIMHEYRLVDNSKPSSKPPGFDFANKKGASLRLDDWVLCRIYKKNNAQRPMDQDQRDDHMIAAASIPQNLSSTSSMQIDHHHHHHQSMYDGMMNVNDAMNSQLGSSKSTPSQLHLVPHNLLPTKRSLPNLFWSDEGNASSPSTKRFLAENYDARTEDQSTNSIATILSQLPGTPSLHHQAMLGSLGGDGVFGQQTYGVNWYA